MASVEDIQEFRAQLGQSTLATNDAIRSLATTVGAVVRNVGAAAPPVLALQSANQTVRKSSETTVQLSLSDDQLTVSELGDAPYPGAAPPNDGFTFADQMGETSPAETEAKIEVLLEFHRRRGRKLRSAQRTLPDGAWVNNNPENVEDYRLPASPLRSLTHSELNKREQSAVSALAQRQWDKRWSCGEGLGIKKPATTRPASGGSTSCLGGRQWASVGRRETARSTRPSRSGPLSRSL